MGKRVIAIEKPSVHAMLLTIKGLVDEYLQLNEKVKSIAKRKEEIREYCFNFLDASKQSAVVVDNIKFQRIASPKVTYNLKRLIPILKKRGLVGKVLRLIVNEEALAEAMEQGKIGIEEIQKASEVRHVISFRVDRLIKTDPEFEADVPF